MPPVSSPESDRCAPQPSRVTWVIMRQAFDMPEKMMLRSCASTCDFSEPAVSRPHIFTASGIIAIALMICELRDMESRWKFARLR